MKKAWIWALCLAVTLLLPVRKVNAEDIFSVEDCAFSEDDLRNPGQKVTFDPQDGKCNVFFYGKIGTCSITNTVIENLNGMLDILDTSAVNFYCIDILNTITNEEIKQWLTENNISDKFQVMPRTSNYLSGQSKIYSRGSSYLSRRNNGSWQVPMVIITDASGNVRYINSSLESTRLALMRGFQAAGVAVSYNTQELLVKGESLYSDAYRFLDNINKSRAENGVKGLVMDEDLLNVAMQRAVECSIHQYNLKTQERPVLASLQDLSEKAEVEFFHYLPSQSERELSELDLWPLKILDGAYTTAGVGFFKVDGARYGVLVLGTNADVKISPKRKDGTESYAVEAEKGIQVENEPIKAVLGKGGSDTISLYVKNWYVNTSVQPEAYDWSSSAPQIVSVDKKGKYTGVTAGTAYITARNKKNPSFELKFQITVHVKVESLSLDQSSVFRAVGNKFKLKATVLPDDAENKELSWTSTDSSVAEVNAQGEVTPKSVGMTKIKVSTTDGSLISEACYVYVRQAVEEISFEQDKLSMQENDSLTLSPRVSPNSAYMEFDWKSSDASVVVVTKDGTVTAKSKGKATITATAMDGSGKSGACTIVVRAKEDPNGWLYKDGRAYWYEGGMRQGTFDDPNGVLGDGTVRGREIYDPDSDGWYWLDSVYDGAKAVSKEVWMPYIYQNEKNFSYSEILDNAANSGDMANQVAKAIREGTGKWVRYDSNGKMYKGWYTVSGADARLYPDQAGNTYYYDAKTGLMAKGKVKIDGRTYYFDETTGALQK